MERAAATLPLALSDDVRAALRHGRPVVALESTIISHGMPFPQNLATARRVEAVVRAGGATPATIAVLDGRPTVGLTDTQLEALARAGAAAHKLSRRDVAVAIARGATGATTVAATMMLAAAAGIHVFVTGGIGGVHRGAEATFDVSADLTELGRTPVAVVCAGAKSILDIPRTLEVLETQGVAVVAYRTDDFPAFFTARSGCPAPCRMDDDAEIARAVALLPALGSGMLLAVPVPEEHAAAGAEIQTAIDRALADAAAEHVEGAATTPFLLARVRELTGGRSLAANIGLVLNNAAVGARLACQVAELGRGQRSRL